MAEGMDLNEVTRSMNDERRRAKMGYPSGVSLFCGKVSVKGVLRPLVDI